MKSAGLLLRNVVDVVEHKAVGHKVQHLQGWKLLSCSQVKSWVKELIWLLIGCLKTKDQSEARLAL